QVIEEFCISSAVSLDLKVWLQGAYEGPLMSDALRSNGLVPLHEPYSVMGFSGGDEFTTPAVLAVTGNNAIVDWVRVELRSESDPTLIVAARHGLVQRDGDVVDTDSVSPLSFNVAPGDHYVAVLHRNHLGCMTAIPVTLSNTVATVDLRTGTTGAWGTEARYAEGALRMLWSGNVTGDGDLKYTGATNDRDPILQSIGGTIPTNTVGGYLSTDINLDGQVRYTGANNDRDPILQNIGGVVSTAVRVQQLP